MSFFNFFKQKAPADLFGGGNGDSFASAVVINADTSVVGVPAEYDYVASQCGRPRRDWEAQEQRLEMHEGKPYDVLTVALKRGEVRTFYFDVAKYFGK
jgi:hypothetical protein